MKKVLAVNSGSSSFKYKLFSLDNEKVIASGMADRVGLPGSVFTMTLADGSQHDEQSLSLIHIFMFTKLLQD